MRRVQTQNSCFVETFLKQELGQVVDWSRIDPDDYLFAMERSPVRDREIKALLRDALTDRVTDRQTYMKSVDASYRYEGYCTYVAEDLAKAREKTD